MLEICKKRKRKLEIDTDLFFKELSPKKASDSLNKFKKEKKNNKKSGLRNRPNSKKKCSKLDELMKRRAKVNSKTIVNSNSLLKFKKNKERNSMKKELDYIKQKLKKQQQKSRKGKLKMSDLLTHGSSNNQFNFSGLTAKFSKSLKSHHAGSRASYSRESRKIHARTKILHTNFNLSSKLQKKLMTRSLKKAKNYESLRNNLGVFRPLLTPKENRKKVLNFQFQNKKKKKIFQQQRMTVGGEKKSTLFEKLKNDRPYRDFISPTNRLSLKNPTNFFQKSTRTKGKLLSLGNILRTPEKNQFLKRNLKSQILKSYEKKSRSKKKLKEKLRTEGSVRKGDEAKKILKEFESLGNGFLSLKESRNVLNLNKRTRRKVSLAIEEDGNPKNCLEVKNANFDFLNNFQPNLEKFSSLKKMKPLKNLNPCRKFKISKPGEILSLKAELKVKFSPENHTSKQDFPDDGRLNLPQELREIPKLIIPKIEWNNFKSPQTKKKIFLPLPSKNNLNQDFSCPANERSYSLYEILKMQETTYRSLKTDRISKSEIKKIEIEKIDAKNGKFSKSSKKQRSSEVKKETKNKGNLSSRKIYFGKNSSRESFDDEYFYCDEDGDLNDWDVSNYDDNEGFKEEEKEIEFDEIGELELGKKVELSSIEQGGTGRVLDDEKFGFEFSVDGVE